MQLFYFDSLDEREYFRLSGYFHRSAEYFPFQEFTGRKCVTCVRLSANYNLPSFSQAPQKMIHICRAEDGEVFQVCAL